MFCQQCGGNLQPEAKFCNQCGTSTSNLAVKPTEYSSNQNVATNESDAIWNPNAASNWSIIFTPIFGSYIHALNWRTLGEQNRAKSAMGWFYFSLALLFVIIFMMLFSLYEKTEPSNFSGLGFIYLAIWYYFAGQAQAKYVNNKFGDDYERRSWWKPFFMGVVGYASFFFVLFMGNYAIIYNQQSMSIESKLLGTWEVSIRKLDETPEGAEVELTISGQESYYRNGKSSGYGNMTWKIKTPDNEISLRLYLKATSTWSLYSNELTETIVDITFTPLDEVTKSFIKASPEFAAAMKEAFKPGKTSTDTILSISETTMVRVNEDGDKITYKKKR